MLIYTPVITNRIQFIMKMMIGKLLLTEYEITDNAEYYKKYDGVKFAYCHEKQVGISFIPSSILYEQGISKQSVDPVEWKNLKLFFPVANSPFPFDPFAVSFYLLTRYEEYLPDSIKDEHGRFELQNAVSYQLGFHRKPVVDILAVEIGNILKNYYPEFNIKKNNFKQIDTYDLDIAYQYKGKSLGRFLGSLGKAILEGNFDKSKKLILTSLGKDIKDPFDTYNLHRERAQKSELQPVHFILTARFGKYDRNINPHGKVFEKLIKQLATFSEIGLHPSYHTYDNPKLLKKEKILLEKKSGQNITKSRQHFLRFKFPVTFQHLIDCGIREDYSLGWHRDAGFRASTANSFPFYDLSQERETTLIFHPLTVMDGALRNVAGTKEEQEILIDLLRKEVQNTGGEFIVLRHNSYSDTLD